MISPPESGWTWYTSLRMSLVNAIIWNKASGASAFEPEHSKCDRYVGPGCIISVAADGAEGLKPCEW